MNFLSPWFLLGTLAVAGPVLFHLLRRSARERLPFSSLMFLSPTPPRAVRRRKLEHLWLLLLRCGCVGLLATAFARPFLSHNTPVPTSPAPARQIVLLLDTSASMRRAGVWNSARAVAEKYLAETGPQDQVALMTFDQSPRMWVSFKEWLSWPAAERAGLARQRLSTLSPGWMGTRLGVALTGAAEQLMNDSAAASPADRRELVLITDLQEGARLDGLQGYEWPARTSVVVERIVASPRGGAGLEILDASRSGTDARSGVPVRVTNDRESSHEKFLAVWSGPAGTDAAGKPTEIYLPPGQTRSLFVPIPGTPTAALHLTGGELEFSSLAYYVAPESRELIVAYLGMDSSNNPAGSRYYLERTFSSISQRHIRLTAPASPAAGLQALLQDAAFAFIPESLTAEQAQTVANWLKGGKSALLILSDSQMGPTLAALAGIPDVRLAESAGNYALLGEIDFTHPLFADFSDPRFSDFTRIHFWKHRRWEVPTNPPVRVLARFDDGSPALAQIPVGGGNLLVLSSGWDPVDSQLAVSSKFVPLMQTMLDWTEGFRPVRRQFRTGDSLPSPVASGHPIRWLKPDGSWKDLAAGRPFEDTDLRGIYMATTDAQSWSFAVNVPLEESRTVPLSPDELARLGVPIATASEISTAPVPERLRRLQAVELENRQKIWRWLIAGVLAFSVVEIVVGGWLMRPVRTTEAGV